MYTAKPLLQRIAETDRRAVHFTLNGRPASALEGDTVLTAVLTHCGELRHNEFSGEPRAGFCMMGACQDCWMQATDGERIRACSTFIASGMNLSTGGLLP